MGTKARKITHERFHSSTGVHTKIIGKDNFTYRHILQILDKFVQPNMTILDIGCGSGTIAFYLASKGMRVHGIDISSQAIEQCNKSAVQLGLEKSTSFDVIDFPKQVPQGSFDFVIMTEVIEHLENDEIAVKRLYSLLKPSGMLLITTPSINAPLHKMGLAKEFDKRVGHQRRYNLEDLEKLIIRNGFKILETQKTEGIVRNFLFLNPIAGKSVRYIKFFLSDVATAIDLISLKMFGESNLFVLAQKKK
jgi:2-polyprenyl-3-methyl-5-hydroxy-6-metoxy-1,4-benzoquinol methylase